MPRQELLKYFIQENDHAKCKFCKKRFILRKFSIFNIGDHVLNKHAEEYHIISSNGSEEDWQFYTTLDYQTRCKWCEKVYMYVYCTTDMKYHLQKYHTKKLQQKGHKIEYVIITTK